MLAALAGCADTSPPNGTGPSRGTGTIDLLLDLPSGVEDVDFVDVHIECEGGLAQDHELDVRDGVAALSAGGLDAGLCTATLTAVGDQGTDCAGSEDFTVIENDVVRVSVTLTCQGDNVDPGGGVVISHDFVVRACTTDRIRKLYAIPSSLTLGSSTDVEVELHPGTIVGSPVFSFAVTNDAMHPGEASLTPGICAAGSQACRAVTCDGIGGSTSVDPLTGLAVGPIWVEVTVEDDECRDSERVEIDCLSSCSCGDGTICGVETCDDANTSNGDGCSNACDQEVCGDGVVNNNGMEECDGTAGVPVGLGQTCDPVTCQLSAPCFCGDNVVCSPGEQCDGTATPAGRTCSATCQFVPVCGNGFVEGTEACDDGNVMNGAFCSSTCTLSAVCVCGDNVVCAFEQCDGTAGLMPGQLCSPTCQIIDIPDDTPCLDCVTMGPIAEALTNDLCSLMSDPLCYAVLQCYIGTAPGNAGCFANGASPAECYCGAGADTDLCATAAFVPTGPCATQMRAAKPGATNAEILDGVFGFDTLGWAGQIMLEAQGLCPADCGF